MLLGSVVSFLPRHLGPGSLWRWPSAFLTDLQSPSRSLLGYVCVQQISRVQLRPHPTLDCGLPGSSVRGILQVRVLEQVPFPPPGDLPDPGVKPVSPALQAGSSPLSHHGASWSWVIVSTSPLPPWKDCLRNIGDTLPLRLNVSGGDRASRLLTL